MVNEGTSNEDKASLHLGKPSRAIKGQAMKVLKGMSWHFLKKQVVTPFRSP